MVFSSDDVQEPGVNVTSVSKESCTLLCVVDQLSGGTLSWYEGEDLVNQTSTQLFLPLTVDRLGLQSSYRCVFANPVGNLTQSVNVNTSCTVKQPPGKKSSHTLPPFGLHRKLKDTANVAELFVTRVLCLFCIGGDDNSNPNGLVWIVIPIILSVMLSICVIVIVVCVKRKKTGRDPQGKSFFLFGKAAVGKNVFRIWSKHTVC